MVGCRCFSCCWSVWNNVMSRMCCGWWWCIRLCCRWCGGICVAIRMSFGCGGWRLAVGGLPWARSGWLEWMTRMIDMLKRIIFHFKLNSDLFYSLWCQLYVLAYSNTWSKSIRIAALDHSEVQCPVLHSNIFCIVLCPQLKLL